jgi:hypothetical protein
MTCGTPVPSGPGLVRGAGAACGSLEFAAHPANAGRRRRIPNRHPASPLSGLAPAGHFSAGFAWSVIEKKWPGFEAAFLGFEPKPLLAQPDEFWERLAGDSRIVRNAQKITAVRANAQFISEIAAESLRKLSQSLREMGHRIGRTLVGELLHQLDYSLQANRKTRGVEPSGSRRTIPLHRRSHEGSARFGRAGDFGRHQKEGTDRRFQERRARVATLAALRPNGENLWVVGDGKQSIYRFRGASSFNMARFGKDDFPSGRRGRLTLNYRSRREIVNAFSNFALDMKADGKDSVPVAESGAGGAALEHRTVTEASQQIVAVADAIEEMRGAGYAYRDQAVLCTGNEKLSTLGQELEGLGIPVLFLGSLFERAEVKDLLTLLSLLTGRRAMGLTRIACMGGFEMSLGDVWGCP